ncbi:diguanylate cyclase [uncultured Roseovarius sp.]|uniref:diguanylate cyclase n=1 Tax=uncultured Roseovarius sp. TaxID=293344 RepID=UPI0026360763|nr:diguanylate cyclase [uncultured Roseovarius sp.]
MSGKILIVDELATNRIVLKVKLSAAYYDVFQARSGTEALKMAQKFQPDLIIASTELSDFDSSAFVRAVHNCATIDALPVILILAQDTPQARIKALEAGASEVLSKPVDETLLLARLRSLLRQRHMDHDLKLHSGTATALGFAEAQKTFVRPGRVAVVAQKKPDATRLRATLSARANHEYLAMSSDCAGGAPNGSKQPDIFVLKFDADACDDGLRLMAELRAAPGTRNCPIIVLLPNESAKLAATVLDMGANDVICGEIDPHELTLRVKTQLDFKQSADLMRDQLHIGLQAAVIDPLTGLYNRRYALPFLDRLIRSSQADGRSFAVMVADLDHFKQVNDRYGHAAGDAVLSRVADTLRANLGDDDLIARIGGEEFLIVTPDTNKTQARQTASKLCRIIQQTPINVPGQREPIEVTVSVGVAMGQRASCKPAMTVEGLLDHADRALYGSKADGRNTVTLCARTAA